MARHEEMAYIKKKDLDCKATRAHAQSPGKKIIGDRWLDTNKGDSETEHFRSRLVATELMATQ